MKIEGTLEILNIENWNTKWDDDLEKIHETQTMIIEIRKAIHERCGIDIFNIKIDLKVSE